MVNKINRNISIDFGRFIAALLVVIIHVPIFKGASVLVPLARCAVPFFYIISGYYLFSNESQKLNKRLKNNIKKWGILWLQYTLWIGGIVYIMNVVIGDYFFFHREDAIKLIRTGVCRALNVVYTNDKEYGFSVLWFLYGGTLAFLLMYILRKYLYKASFQIGIIIFHTIIIIFWNLNEHSDILPFIRSSFPFLLIGFMIHQYETQIDKLLSRNVNKILILFLLFTLMLERFDYLGSVEIFYSTTPLTVLLFIFLKNTNSKITNIVSKVPIQCTMDIYIWHRPIFGVLCICGVPKIFTDAISIYIISLILSLIVRKKIKLSKKTELV